MAVAAGGETVWFALLAVTVGTNAEADADATAGVSCTLTVGTGALAEAVAVGGLANDPAVTSGAGATTEADLISAESSVRMAAEVAASVIDVTLVNPLPLYVPPRAYDEALDE